MACIENNEATAKKSHIVGDITIPVAIPATVVTIFEVTFIYSQVPFVPSLKIYFPQIQLIRIC